MKRLNSILMLISLLIGQETYAQTIKRTVIKNPHERVMNKTIAPLEFEDMINAPEGTIKLGKEDFQGKPVILEFWATWCAPCIKQFPKINKLTKEFEGRITFISITDESKEKVAHFLKRKTLDTWIAMDTDRSVIEHFGIMVYPSTFVIDKNGKVIQRISPKQLTSEYLEGLLSDQPQNLVSQTNTSKSVKGSNMSVSPNAKPTSKDSKASPIYQVSIEEIEPIKEPEGRWGKFLGFAKVKGWTLRKAISFANGISESLIQGEDSLISKQLAVDIRLPMKDTETFDHLLLEALKSKFELELALEESEEEVWIMTAPNGLSDNLQLSTSKTGHYSTDDGIIGATRTKVGSIIQFVENTLNIKILDESGLDSFYDFNLYWDHEKPESIKEALKTQLNIVLKPEIRTVTVAKVTKSLKQKNGAVRLTLN